MNDQSKRMNSNVYFHSYLPVVNPRVVTPRQMPGKDQKEFLDGELLGTYARVFPSRPREVFALQSLEPGRQKWAPAACHGGGIIVTMDVINGNFA